MELKPIALTLLWGLGVRIAAGPVWVEATLTVQVIWAVGGIRKTMKNKTWKELTWVAASLGGATCFLHRYLVHAIRHPAS